MKTVNKFLLISLSVIFFGLNDISAQLNSFYIYVKQNDKKIKINKNEVELLREAFEIYVEYTAKVDLTVHTSFSGKIFHDAQKGELLFDLIDSEAQKTRVSIFDKKNLLFPQEDEIFIWEKNKTDRDDINMNGKRFVSVKKVEKMIIPKVYIHEVSRQKSTVNMITPMHFMNNDLFFVFIYTEKDKSGENMEVQREILKIKWVDVYKEETDKFKKNKLREDKIKIKEAERKLKYKQKKEKSEKKALDKLDKNRKKREAKEQKKEDKGSK